jgi:hypothetical protein
VFGKGVMLAPVIYMEEALPMRLAPQGAIKDVSCILGDMLGPFGLGSYVLSSTKHNKEGWNDRLLTKQSRLGSSQPANISTPSLP